MSRVTSRDGTAIAYRSAGSGPPIVLVGGSLDDGAENEPLADALAGRFTVVNYTRRGRGASGDTLPYAVAREIEDLAALVDRAGPPVRLHGVSTGGALALEAAAAGLPVVTVSVYEVPYSVGPHAVQAWREYVDRLDALLAQDRRGDALELFMAVAGAPPDDILAARESPVWAGLEALAHTLGYDAACLGAGGPPADRLAGVTQPVLVATGDDRHGFFAVAADAVAAHLPRAERRAIDGQGHVADARTMAAVLEEFHLRQR